MVSREPAAQRSGRCSMSAGGVRGLDVDSKDRGSSCEKTVSSAARQHSSPCCGTAAQTRDLSQIAESGTDAREVGEETGQRRRSRSSPWCCLFGRRATCSSRTGKLGGGEMVVRVVRRLSTGLQP